MEYKWGCLGNWVHNDKEQKEEDIIRKYFVRMGLPFVLLSILALCFAVGMKVFEDTLTTIGYLSTLIVLGLFWFILGILLDMHGLLLRVYASAGLCIQVSMNLIFSIHFVWPRHEIAVGLISTVLVAFLCFLAIRREGKMESRFLRDKEQNERNEVWKSLVCKSLPCMNYVAVGLFLFNTMKTFENAPTTSVYLAVLNGCESDRLKLHSRSLCFSDDRVSVFMDKGTSFLHGSYGWLQCGGVASCHRELVDIVKRTFELGTRGVEYGEEELRYRTTINPCVVV
ncbi:hypothetical protein Tco_0513539 [Tanacetum coccineum]